MVPSGTGVLYFVVVARLTLPKQKKLSVQALQPIEDMLRKLGLGGERGYGVLQDSIRDHCTVHIERLTSPNSTRRRMQSGNSWLWLARPARAICSSPKANSRRPLCVRRRFSQSPTSKGEAHERSHCLLAPVRKRVTPLV